MRSFQTLVTLVTLMVFASKEAGALPQSQVARSVNEPAHAGYPTSTGDLDFVRPRRRPLRRPLRRPAAGPRKTVSSTLNTNNNQVGVIGGNAYGNGFKIGSAINPSSINRARDLEARDDLESGFFFPIFRPSAPAAPSKTVSSTLNTNNNLVGVVTGDARGNTFTIGNAINPSSTNSARDLEARDDLESGFFFPFFRPPSAAAPSKTVTSNLNTNDNAVGVVYGNAQGNNFDIGSAINPTSTNTARDLEARDDLESGFFFPIFRPPSAAAPSKTVSSTLNTNNNAVGVVTGNAYGNGFNIGSAINPSSINRARDIEARDDLESGFFFPIFRPPSPAAPSKTVSSTLNTNGNAVGVVYGTAQGNNFDIGSAINPTSTNSARDLEARDDLESGFFFPIFRPPSAAAPSKTVSSTLNTNNNGVGVISGDATNNKFTIGSAINPSSINRARDLEARGDLESGFFFPIFRPPSAAAPSKTVSSTLNTNNNGVGVISGDATNNKFTIGSAINPTSTNRAREVDVPPSTDA